MRHLLSPEGARAITAVLDRSPLIAFDFDGTLAPIVARPDDARVPEAMADALRELAARHPLAVISGRDADDLRARLGFDPRWVVGNHGAEHADVAQALVAAARSALDAWRRALAGNRSALEALGVEVEDKRLSIALHYRRAADPEGARRYLEGLVRNLPPELGAFGGKFVLNVVARALPDKGDTLRSLVRRTGAGAAFFAGDDVNDESVFEQAEPHWLTVRIGRDDPRSRAMYGLDSHDELLAVLAAMLDH
jgi:trehalose 6-phosphate phosphatase